MVTGLTGNFENDGKMCGTCLDGWQNKLPNSGRRTQTNRPLQLVHNDLCGPISPVSWNDKKYILTFIDDYS